jgi:hypothetical protein
MGEWRQETRYERRGCRREKKEEIRRREKTEEGR